MESPKSSGGIFLRVEVLVLIVVLVLALPVMFIGHKSEVAEMRALREELSSFRQMFESTEPVIAAPSPVTATASGNTVTINTRADEEEAIREKAKRQGYFTTEDLTFLEDRNRDTINRWIDGGLITPAPRKNSSGVYEIPTDYRVAK